MQQDHQALQWAADLGKDWSLIESLLPQDWQSQGTGVGRLSPLRRHCQCACPAASAPHPSGPRLLFARNRRTSPVGRHCPCQRCGSPQTPALMQRLV